MPTPLSGSADACRSSRLIQWARSLEIGKKTIADVSTSSLRAAFEDDLKHYFALCGLARSKSARHEHAQHASKILFKTRVILEKSIMEAVNDSSASEASKIQGALSRPLFGSSKKQGTSVRMPLATCHPTSMCANACYAHDVLDATPGALIRGALNGWIAGVFERANSKERSEIAGSLIPHVRKAVAAALKEISELPHGYTRRPFIRFSHVGEIVFFPAFANALARLVKDESRNSVDCVVYTRHKNVQQLDPTLWIINFTLDPASMDRRSWIPSHSRTVFSAFGGVTSDIAEVNFLEHHRHIHMQRSSGEGRICPATKPETKVRTCDACRCNRCFVPPVAPLLASHA